MHHFPELVAKLALCVTTLLLLPAMLLHVAKRSLMRKRRPRKMRPSTTASTLTLKKMRTPPRTPPKMMMSRWTSCSFSFSFWHLMTKGE